MAGSGVGEDGSDRISGRPVEWPTVGLALCIYGTWIALTLCHALIPWWLLLPAGAWITAWHMSLQHELLHGHPTGWQRLNNALGFPPLSLWLPYARYRALHLAHHAGSNLTDPIDDPESHYILPQHLARLRRPMRCLLIARNTLLGRLLVGPAYGIVSFLLTEVRLLQRNKKIRRLWLWHLLAAASVVIWLALVCRMSLLIYAACFVYPGYALALVRSFAEHRAAPVNAHRTAIVERAPILGLLFLHNNLHVLHHLRPALPWYRLPAEYQARRTEILTLNGGLLYRGYLDVARRYLWRPHDRPDNIFIVPTRASPERGTTAVSPT